MQIRTKRGKCNFHPQEKLLPIIKINQNHYVRHIPAYVFQRYFLCDFVVENTSEKNVRTTVLICLAHYRD